MNLMTTAQYSRNSLEQTARDPQNQFLLSDVLLICRIGLLHVHYYSKPNNAQKINWFVLYTACDLDGVRQNECLLY